jgi:hypothetical protein
VHTFCLTFRKSSTLRCLQRNMTYSLRTAEGSVLLGVGGHTSDSSSLVKSTRA